MRKWIVHMMLILTLPVAGQEMLYTFMNDDGIHLRWKGKYDTNFEGYNVYRKIEGGDWIKLNTTPLRYASSTDQAIALSGNKSQILYALLDKEGGPIEATELKEAVENSIIFESVCVVNPELAWMLGERFTDVSAQKGKRYSYKIAWMDGKKELNWLEKDIGQPFSNQTVPAPGMVDVKSGDAYVTLSNQPSSTHLKSGDAITWSIFRSDKDTGPFEKISYENYLPISVSTNGQPTPATLSYLDNYLNNDITQYYKVKMVNAVGIESAFSKVYKATPKTEIVELSFEAFDTKTLASTTILSWEMSRSGSPFEIYVKRGTKAEFVISHSGITQDGTSQWIDTDYRSGEINYYFMVALDGEKKLYSDTLNIVSLDILPPPVPLNVTAELIDSFVVKLTWDEPTHEDLLGYEVERLGKSSRREGLKVSDTYFSETEFYDTLNSGAVGDYFYRIFAYDQSYNSSNGSELVKIKLADYVPPLTPLIWALNPIGDSLRFEWSESADEDLAYFEVYGINCLVNGASSERTLNNQLLIAMPDTGRYGFSVSAVDSSENRSIMSEILFYTKKPSLPEPPKIVEVGEEGYGLKIIWNTKKASRIHMLLLSRIDPVTNKKLDVWQGKITVSEFIDLYADPSKSWRYEIKAYDKDWKSTDPDVYLYQPPEKE